MEGVVDGVHVYLSLGAGAGGDVGEGTSVIVDGHVIEGVDVVWKGRVDGDVGHV